MDNFMNFISSYPIILVPVGLVLLWMGIGTFWNSKIVPRRREKGIATDTFNGILGRTIRYTFKEESTPAKVYNDVGEAELKYPALGKWGTWTNLYLLGFLVTVILGLINPQAASFIFLGTIATIILRANKVFTERHNKLIRMFEVAAVELNYPREANLNPWGWINIRSWERVTQPGNVNVRFPAKFQSDEIRNREKFESHFNGTVTSDNTWLYEWKSSESVINVSPVTHIPTFAPYPGSAQGSWEKIPLGLGAEGEVFWDVSKSPMALVTGTTGGGKASSLQSNVPTVLGTRQIKDLKVGDILFDPEGNPTKVTHLHPIMTPAKAYEVTFSNGEKEVVDPGHLWETETRESRLGNVKGNAKGKSKRKRVRWLGTDARHEVEKALEFATNDDTISIKEVGELTRKAPNTQLFYSIAREIGVAEEVVPQLTMYHNAKIVKQMQTMTYANSAQFMEVYNNRKHVAQTAKSPLTKNQHDKLRQLHSEVRDSDTLTAENVAEYLGGNKHTQAWVEANYDASAPTLVAVGQLYELGENVHGLLPDKIFSIDAEYINGRQFASLIGAEYNKSMSRIFNRFAKRCSDTMKKKEAIDLVRPERTTTQAGAPYSTYPKRMFLSRVLENDDSSMGNRQRFTPEIRTTQEIFDTLQTTGATVYTNHSIRRSQALVLPERDLPVHPYVFGVWLGVESSQSRSVSELDPQLLERVASFGYSSAPESFSDSLNKALRERGSVYAPRKLKASDLLKHALDEYLTSSIEQRHDFLRGLLDSYGAVKDAGFIQFNAVTPEVRDGVKRLVASLGYIPHVSKGELGDAYVSDESEKQTVWTVTFHASPEDCLFAVNRKIAMHADKYERQKDHSTSDVHYIVSVKEVAPVPMRCISVDSPSRLFLVGDSMIPTHNSTIQRNIIFHCIQHPDRWRFLGIDVKQVELSMFESYDPVIQGIAVDVPDGVEVIRYAKEVMMDRYALMKTKNVNHFEKLNDPNMKALMVMVDETYMFLALSGIKTDEGKEEDAQKGEASKLIGDIARLGRAAGVHLTLATQRPDATVIYGELKQNLVLRVAAGRADSTASLMTLDNDKATRLPGNIKGRGYVQANGDGEQFQGYFAPEKWIDKFLNGQSEWLKAWEEKGLDLDKPSDLKKWGGTATSPKLKLAKEDTKELGKNKSGGLMSKINAYNNSQAKKGADERAEFDEDKFEAEEDAGEFTPQLEVGLEPVIPVGRAGERDELRDIAKSFASPESNDMFAQPFATETDENEVSGTDDQVFFVSNSVNTVGNSDGTGDTISDYALPSDIDFSGVEEEFSTPGFNGSDPMYGNSPGMLDDSGSMSDDATTTVLNDPMYGGLPGDVSTTHTVDPMYGSTSETYADSGLSSQFQAAVPDSLLDEVKSARTGSEPAMTPETTPVPVAPVVASQGRTAAPNTFRVTGSPARPIVPAPRLPQRPSLPRLPQRPERP